MNIIFGDAANQLPRDYVVLELDTFLIKPTDTQVTTWCVVESVPPTELFQLDRNKKLHSDLITEYKSQNWDGCLGIIKSLKGLWDGEVDSFYDEIEKRAIAYKQESPEPGWTGLVIKHAVPS